MTDTHTEEVNVPEQNKPDERTQQGPQGDESSLNPLCW